MENAGRRMRLRTLCGFVSLLTLMPAASSFADSETKSGRVWPQQESRNPAKSESERERLGNAKAQSYVLVGAGDIAGCSSLAGAAATAKLIEGIPGTVFAAGDLAYDRGTAEEFHRCYDATWGKFKGRTRPALGNHEYYSQGGKVYFEYWGERAGPAGKGYYSYELGNWHVVVLNTNCASAGVGGCGASSEQEKWLREDLAAH